MVETSQVVQIICHFYHGIKWITEGYLSVFGENVLDMWNIGTYGLPRCVLGF